jgi:hypothetical protein
MTEHRSRSASLFLIAMLIAGPAIAATASPKAPAAMIRVNAQPMPARVFLDSVDLGFAPIEIPQRDTLTHQIMVEARWFRSWSLPVKFDPRTDRSIDASLRRKEGLLIVVTDPPGAIVSVNGSIAGHSPQTLDRQLAGTYEVAASLKGYQTATATIMLDEERTYSWTPVLAPKTGQIVFSGWPSQAVITCKNRAIGSVPMVWDNLKQGSYTFEIKRPGFEPAVLRTYVTTDSAATVAVRLQPTRALTAIRKSMLIPGSGQYYRGYPDKGLLFKGGWFVSLAMLATAFNDRESRYEHFNGVVRQYQNANQYYDERYQEVLTSYRGARDSNRRLNIVIAAVAVFYAANILDAALSVPNREDFRDHAAAARRSP